DIAVLRAMGATGDMVSRIFRVQGLAVGVSGIVLGVAIGSLVAWKLGTIIAFFENLTSTRVFDPAVYFISEIPSQLQWQDVVLIVTACLILSFLATLFPARRAGLVSPAEVMRYDQ